VAPDARLPFGKILRDKAPATQRSLVITQYPAHTAARMNVRESRGSKIHASSTMTVFPPESMFWVVNQIASAGVV
jgi:hypothetical protein